MAVKFQGDGHRTTAAGLTDAAKEHGIEVDALKAVIAVETNGKPYDEHGRVSMLFEPHIFYRLLQKHATPAHLALAVRQGIAYAHQGEHPYPRDSYPHFEAACLIDEELACEAASWGMGQILGSNFASTGCGTASQMVEIMAAHPDSQIEFMVQFIVSENLLAHLNKHNWTAFAHGYNGPNYAVNHYDTKLRDAYAKFHVAPRVAVAGPVHVEAVLVHPDAPNPRPSSALQARLGTAPLKPGAFLSATPAPPAGQPKENPMDLPLIGKVEPGEAMKAAVTAGEVDIRWVQQRLKDLGYFEVGLVDGKMGQRTQGAILAFRNEAGLTLHNGVDDALKLALIAAKPRAVSEERANTTVAQLRPRSPILQAATYTKILAAATGVVGAATSYFGAIQGDMDTAQQQIAPFKLAFAFLPPWAYGVAVMVLGTGIWIQGHQVEIARLKQFQTGRAS